MDHKIFWNIGDWSSAVAAMPTREPLPCRTVLVPRECVAHVLRRELIRMGRTDALAGTRFVATPFAAAEVLRGAGTAFQPGEETLRAARLLALFRSELRLVHFPLDLLRSKPGWDEAFASTISDLEGAGIRPSDLSKGSERLRDVAAIWSALEESAGNSWTIQRIYLEAAAQLERDPAAWPFQGATLASASIGLTVAEARFQRSIPRLTVGLLAARPPRERLLRHLNATVASGDRKAMLWRNPPAAGSVRRARRSRTPRSCRRQCRR